jgi:hypothetical protein
MAQIVKFREKWIRISRENPHVIERSKDREHWTMSSDNPDYGEFDDLTADDKEIVASTSRGTFYSTNDGTDWHYRK